jgi:photosystem II stability/assembly factor-like uncharacterized protein
MSHSCVKDRGYSVAWIAAWLAIAGCGSSSPSTHPDSPPPVDASDGRTGSELPDGWVDDSDVIGNSSVELIRFVDSQRGFMLVSDGPAHGLHRTSDGGVTWVKADIDASPYGVGFSPGLDVLWLVGSGPPFRSADGGRTFARLDTLPSDFHGYAHLWDTQIGIVTSEVGDRVHRTIDGAATWTTHAFGRDLLPGTRRTVVLGDDVWIVGGPISAPEGKAAHVAHSPDRAVSWTVSTLQDNAHDLKGGQLLGAFAVSATDVWVVGQNRQIFHTTDGGTSWQQITGIPPQVLNPCEVLVRGNTVTVAASLNTPKDSYGILESTDGGTTFALTAVLPAPYLGDASGIHGMTAAPGGGYWIYGYAGLFYRKRT